MGLMKQIAILFDIEGKSAEQIAKELGLPVSAVREIVKIALGKVRVEKRFKGGVMKLEFWINTRLSMNEPEVSLCTPEGRRRCTDDPQHPRMCTRVLRLDFSALPDEEREKEKLQLAREAYIRCRELIVVDKVWWKTFGETILEFWINTISIDEPEVILCTPEGRRRCTDNPQYPQMCTRVLRLDFHLLPDAEKEKLKLDARDAYIRCRKLIIIDEEGW